MEEKSMNKSMLFAGTGGQGVVSLGKIVATAALKDVPYITYYPSYGAEVRGGTANCQIVLAEKEIASPVSEVFDIILLLNQASLDKFIGQASPTATIIVNSTICSKIPDDPRIIKIDASKIAIDLNNPRGANLVMLGAMAKLDTTLSVENLELAIKDKFKGKKDAVIAGNLQCFQKGQDLS
jgi:2-oxoglutarate ferredoxin oxidoreductase subunit gamma